MKKREAQKAQTRKLLLETGRNLISKNGCIPTTIAEIAKAANVAKGTMFVHFKNKEALFIEIFDKELEKIGGSLCEIMKTSSDFIKLLSLYLDFLEEREDFFVSIKKELPFYDDELRRKILFRELMVQEHFYNSLEKGMNENKIKTCNPTNLIQIIFGSINHYLTMKSFFAKDESVIAKIKTDYIQTIKRLILIDETECKHNEGENDER